MPNKLPSGSEMGFYACFYCANSHQFGPYAAEVCKCVCHEKEPPEHKAKNEEWRKRASDRMDRAWEDLFYEAFTTRDAEVNGPGCPSLGERCRKYAQIVERKIEEARREGQLSEHKLTCHKALLQYDEKMRLTGNLRCGEGWKCERLEELEKETTT